MKVPNSSHPLQILFLFLFFSFYFFIAILAGVNGSVVKNPLANAGDAALISGSGRCLGEGNGTPLQYSCMGIPWTEEPDMGVTKAMDMT